MQTDAFYIRVTLIMKENKVKGSVVSVKIII